MGYECARGTREGTNIRYGTLFYLCRLLYLPTSSYHLQDSSIAISSSLHFLFSAATLVFKREICFLSFFLSLQRSLFIVFFFDSFFMRIEKEEENALLFICQNPSNPLSPLFLSLRPHTANTHCCCCCHSIECSVLQFLSALSQK